MITIDELIPTQFSIRDMEAVERMVQYILQGGYFNRKAIRNHSETIGSSFDGLIAIAEFEDGAHYIRDGHHRLAAIHLADKRELHEFEYEIERWTYGHFMELTENSISKGWVTPFSPKEEVRIADFIEYKKSVPENVEEARHFIQKSWNDNIYTMKRSLVCCDHISDVIENSRLELSNRS